MARIACDPSESVETLTEQAPAARTQLVSGVVPSLIATVPVGVPPALATVTAIETGAPSADGSGLVVTVVVVAAFATVSDVAAELSQ